MHSDHDAYAYDEIIIVMITISLCASFCTDSRKAHVWFAFEIIRHSSRHGRGVTGAMAWES